MVEQLQPSTSPPCSRESLPTRSRSYLSEHVAPPEGGGETEIDASWSLSYLTNGPNEMIQTVLNSSVIPVLVANCTVVVMTATKLPLS